MDVMVPLRTLLVIFACVAIAPRVIATFVAHDLLIILGAVSHGSARILVELLPEKPLKPSELQARAATHACASTTAALCLAAAPDSCTHFMFNVENQPAVSVSLSGHDAILS